MAKRKKRFEHPERTLTANESAMFDVAERIQLAGGKHLEIEFVPGYGSGYFRASVCIERGNAEQATVYGMQFYPCNGAPGRQLAEELRRYVQRIEALAVAVEGVR